MRSPTFISAVLLFGLVTGCKTASNQSHPLTGDPLIDGPIALTNGPPKDKTLWHYRMALAHLHRGEFAAARRDLDDGLGSIGMVFTEDKAAKKARHLFHSEARKNFLGEPYERVMACYYRGILYWMDGEPENARACFRSGEITDTGQIIQANGSTNSYAADYALLDYLDGYVTARIGKDGQAEFKRAESETRGEKPPPYNTNANILFFVDFGRGPAKCTTNRYGSRLAFERRDSPVRFARIKVGVTEIELQPYDDLFFQATTRGGRLMDDILATKAEVKEAAEVVGDVGIVAGLALAAASQNKDIGLMVLATSVAIRIIAEIIKPAADTRSWDNLPNFLTFAALELPPGDQLVTVDFLSSGHEVLPNLSKSLTVKVPATTSDKIVFVSDASTTPETQ